MDNYLTIGKRIVRKDGASKATGELKYMLDKQYADMLYAKILYPPFFRAKIKNIDTSEAEQSEDVVTVVTAKDLPGQKFHGLIFKDHPVICENEVNYKGDVVAVVVAKTEQAAIEARKKIKVIYEELPAILTIEDAMAPDAPVIHEGGNIGSEFSYQNGDVETVFRTTPHVFEHVFETGYQEHATLETEGGIAVPTKDGGLEIWYGCQNGHRAKRDLIPILNLAPDKVEVISSPLGGGFGRRDELLLQGLLGICALKTKKPVAMTLSREETFQMGPKRMPTQIRIRIAADKNGQFQAISVDLIGKSGPYASYTPAVLDYSMQMCTGIYYFPKVDISGKIVYTNNFLTSAFRGFGNNQVSFAIETMVDIIAESLSLDRLELRSRNMIRPGGLHSFGNVCSTCYNSEKLLQAVQESYLYNHAQEFKAKTEKPWLKRGVGVALVHQGVGLGNHLPDESGSEVELTEDGRLCIYFGNEDMGQGSITTLQMIASEAMHMPIERIDSVNGDTKTTPDSGPITASRVTYITGKSICGAILKLQEEIAKVFGCETGQLVYTEQGIGDKTWEQVARMLSPEQRKQKCHTAFENEERDISFGLNLFFSHAAQISAVEVNTLTGEVRVLETEQITACGTVINRLGYEGQCEGGIVMSQGFALYEDFQQGTKNYTTYLIPTMADCPTIRLNAIEDPETSGPYGAKGLGEIVNVTGTPAILNAIYDAVKIRFCKIPVTKEKMLMSLTKR